MKVVRFCKILYFRYIVVCHPFFAWKRESLFSHPQVQGPQKSSVDYRRVLTYASVSFVFSALICIPTFFEFKIGQRNDNTSTIFISDFRRNNRYFTWIYSVGFDVLVRYIIPVSVLFITNYR